MNTNALRFPLAAALASLAVLPVFADDPAPAAPAPEAPAAAPAAPEASTNAVRAVRPRPQPGPQNRRIPPEMRAYMERLEALRVARDEQARAAIQAEKDIEARKTALAGENEDVKALVDKIAGLRESLAESEKSLAEFYAKDEDLSSLEAKKADAEKERDAKQREMHAAVAAAMDERAARFRVPPPDPGEDSVLSVPPLPAPAPAPAEAPAPAGK